MITIKLHKDAWEYDPSVPLGPPGGFGTVYLGKKATGEEVAVKKLHISAGAAGNRELVISEDLSTKALKYVIPFFDYGIDADTNDYFIVMAKATKSLQDEIKTGAMSEQKSIGILTEIARGLKEVGAIIHRDLKPGNVLLHDNIWKLADFGIARFVEKTTSLNTLKDCLSPQYAAPEQWRLERASKATDIYAFGCISFALVTGQPPFPSGDFRQRHLTEEPARPPVSPKMQQLISLSLRKNPHARPTIDSVLKQLEGIAATETVHGAIAAAGAVVASNEARKDAELSLRQTEENARRELATDAMKSLDFIFDQMFESIQRDAPVAIRESNNAIKLGSGILSVRHSFRYLPKDAFSVSKKNVICGAIIFVRQDATYKGRSANLWFMEVSPGVFRWIEISYFSLAASSSQEYYPYGVRNELEIQDADYAQSHVSHSVQVATSARPIDAEDSDDFIHRWLCRLAAASTNSLQQPNTLPES